MNTYQLSRSWILRYDKHHNAPYTLFDINRGDMNMLLTIQYFHSSHL